MREASPTPTPGFDMDRCRPEAIGQGGSDLEAQQWMVTVGANQAILELLEKAASGVQCRARAWAEPWRD
jgi:hypothetical protein